MMSQVGVLQIYGLFDASKDSSRKAVYVLLYAG